MLISLFKDFIKKTINMRFVFKPYVLSQINSLKDYNLLNVNKREIPLIVSLSAYRENFDDLEITIFSLLNQEIKPDRLILWLDNEYEDLTNIPYEITQFIKNGLEIKFVNSFDKYTDTLSPLKKYNAAINVIAKPEKYYPSNWLKKLYLSYITEPNFIHTYKSNTIALENNKLVLKTKTNTKKSSYNNLFNSSDGVLYPPECFTKEAFRKDVYPKACPTNPDLWFWAMALINNKKINVIKPEKFTLFSINQTIDTKLFENESQNIIKLYNNKIKKLL